MTEHGGQDGPGTVVGAVGAAAAAYPDLPAVIDDRQTLTFADLWRESGRLGARLRARGVRTGDVVALAAERSAGLLVGLLGIVRSGAVVLPLDVTYPAARLAAMLDDSGAAVVVGHEHVLEPFVSGGRDAYVLPRVFDAGPADPDETSLPEPDPVHGCYLLYTSGSTGRPKAVLMPHRNLHDLVRWQVGASVCGPGSRTLQYGAISFDVSLQEIFSTMASGGALVCIDDESRRNPMRAWEVIVREGIHRIFLPYVGLQALVMVADEIDLDAVVLRELIPGGEQLQITRALRAMMRRLPDCRLVNHYGPVETHAVTHHPLGPDPAGWPALPPIGVPIPGNRVYVLDDDGRAVATGEIGELYIAGAQVSYGYWGRPGLTAERFLPAPDGVGERMYRTGDLARWRADGTLDFLGRADDQVKIRGFRVEPAEVEAEMADHPDVDACGATVAGGEGGIDRILVAFVVGRPGLDVEELRADLRARLPEHMVPASVHVVDALPQVPSGKLDRRRLRALAETTATADLGGVPG